MRYAIEPKIVSTQVLPGFYLFLFDLCLTICVDKSLDLTIHKLFATRADLHRTVYTHAKVKVHS